MHLISSWYTSNGKLLSCNNYWVFIIYGGIIAILVSLLYYSHWLLPFYGPLSRTTRLSWYQKKHSLTHIYHDHQSSFICFLHLLRSIASFLFNLRAWKSFCTSSIQVLFGLPLGLVPSTSYFIPGTFLHPVIVIATHAYTNGTCFAVVPRLYHLILVCLLTLYFCLNATHPCDHFHLFQLKCHLVFFSYRPVLTSMQHITLL